LLRLFVALSAVSTVTTSEKVVLTSSKIPNSPWSGLELRGVLTLDDKKQFSVKYIHFVMEAADIDKVLLPLDLKNEYKDALVVDGSSSADPETVSILEISKFIEPDKSVTTTMFPASNNARNTNLRSFCSNIGDRGGVIW
jgi:hypothetical protein